MSANQTIKLQSTLETTNKALAEAIRQANEYKSKYEKLGAQIEQARRLLIAVLFEPYPDAAPISEIKAWLAKTK